MLWQTEEQAAQGRRLSRGKRAVKPTLLLLRLQNDHARSRKFLLHAESCTSRRRLSTASTALPTTLRRRRLANARLVCLVPAQILAKVCLAA